MIPIKIQGVPPIQAWKRRAFMLRAVVLNVKFEVYADFIIQGVHRVHVSWCGRGRPGNGARPSGRPALGVQTGGAG